MALGLAQFGLGKRERLEEESAPLSPPSHHHASSSPAYFHGGGGFKRARRCARSSPSHQLSAAALAAAYGTAAPSPGTHSSSLSQAVATLLAFFPGMDEKTVTSALSDSGFNLDAAIQRLTGLRLHGDDATVAAANAAASGAADAAAPSPQPASTQSIQGQQEAAEPPSSSPAPEEPVAGPQTAEQWVEFLVAEMAKCRDMGDARLRAAAVLQHFERFVKSRGKDETKAKLLDAQRENSILKKAVQIQNSKLNERAGQDQQVQQLQHALAQYQEQVHNLELQKYSLTLHLQKATSGNGVGPHHNPDIF